MVQLHEELAVILMQTLGKQLERVAVIERRQVRLARTRGAAQLVRAHDREAVDDQAHATLGSGGKILDDLG